jgi:hypothetical protein
MSILTETTKRRIASSMGIDYDLIPEGPCLLDMYLYGAAYLGVYESEHLTQIVRISPEIISLTPLK